MTTKYLPAETKMSKLPMQNIGIMPLSQLMQIVTQFDALGNGLLTTDKTDIYLSIKTTRSGVEMLTAARIDANVWHVRAREGMIIAETVPG
jgi:hypothetical protein